MAQLVRLLRAIRIVFAAILLTTCGTDTALAPGIPASSAVDLSGFLRAGGPIPIPIDTVLVELRRLSDSSVAFSEQVDVARFQQQGNDLLLPVALQLRTSPEQFYLFAEARGGGVVYYTVRSTVTAAAGQATQTPSLTPTYVGPGSTADSVVLTIVPGAVAPGDSALATAVVFDNDLPVIGAPVGIVPADTVAVRTRAVGVNSAWLVAPATGSGTTGITATTPTGLSTSGGFTWSAGAGVAIVFVSPFNPTLPPATTQQFTASAVDSNDGTITGLPVSWSSSTPATATISPTGLVTTVAVGTSTITATIGGVQGISLLTVALPGSGPATVATASAPTQSQTVNQLVGADPSVLVSDSSAVPLAGVTVTFAVTSGGGAITGGTATTNVSGIATLGSWRTGQIAGTNTVTATVTGLPAVTFTATGTAGVPDSVAIVSGDAQTVGAGVAVPLPLVVEVQDSFTNVVAGAAVTWATASGGSLAPASGVTAANGRTQTVWTLGPAAPSQTATATVGALAPASFSATATFGPPALSVAFTGVPDVGLGKSAAVRATLPSPAGAGGVIVTLTSDVPGTAQVVNSADTVASGQTAADFTVNGVALGSTTLRANASGFVEGTLPITVQDRSISVPPTLNVPFGQTASVVINIGSPAPVGGVVISVSSDNPTVIGVQTPTVTIPAGGTTANATVQGLLPGTANVTVDNPAYTTDVVVVTSSAALNVVETFVQPNASFPIGINIQLTSAGLGIAAPTGGVTINLVSRNTACALTNTPRTIAAGLVATTGSISAGAGTLPCTTYVVAQATNIQDDSVQVSVAAQPGFNLPGASVVGAGLQASRFASLQASNHGGITIRVASADSTRMLISPNATTPGTGFIDVPVINGNTGVSYYIQALKGTAGSVVAINLTAPGFLAGTVNDSIAPAAMDIIFLSSATTTFSPNGTFQLRTGVANATDAFMSLEQAVRAGALPDTFTVQNDSSVVAQLFTTAFAGQSVTTLIQPGQARSGGNAATGGVEFDPLGAGVTQLSASAANYTSLPQPAPKYTVTVSAPAITVNAVPVLGSGMQTGGFVNLGAANHGGIDVTLQVSDSSLFLLAPNTTTVGSGTLVTHLNNGNSGFSYTLQVLEGQTGTATITAAAPGFTGGSTGATAIAPALDVIFLPGTTTSLAPNSAFQVRLGTPNGQLTALTQEFGLRAGSPGATATVVHVDPAAAKLTTSVLTADTVTTTIAAQQSRSPGSVATGGVEYDPTAPGFDTVSATIPGYVVVNSATQPITVTGQAINLSTPATLGAGMQTGGFGNLGASNHGGVTVHLVVSDSSRFLLARAAGDTLGTGSFDIFVPNGSTSFSFMLQATEGAPATATITATAPGFSPATVTATAIQPAFDIIFLNGTQTTFSLNNEFQVRLGTPNGQLTGLTQEFTLRFGSPGVTASLTSSVPGVGALVTQAGSGATGNVTIAERQSRSPSPAANGGVAFDPLIGGTTVISATIPGYLTLPTASVPVTVNAPGISVSTLTVGAGLQTTGFISLGAANHGGVTVRVTSSQPSIALISDSVNKPGSTFIDVPLANNVSGFAFYVQGVDTVTAPTLVAVTATAPGFTDGTGTTTVQQSGFDIIFLNTNPTSLSPANAFQVRLGVPNSNNTALSIEQGISPASVARTATVTNSNATAGQLVFQSGSAQSGSVTIGVGQARSPSPATAGGVEFLAGAAGTTVVSATIPGFLQMPTATPTVTVTTPGTSLSPVTVGSGLMVGSFGSIGATNHGGVTVQLSSSNPALFLLAPDATTAPSATLNIPLANGQSGFSYVVHGLEGATGTALLTATTPGFSAASVTETVVQPSVDVIFLPANISAGAANVDFQIRLGTPDALGNVLSQEQSLRFGATAVVATVTNGNATAAQLVTGAGAGQSRTTTVVAGSARSPSPLANGGVQFDPLAQGVTPVSVTIPGFRVIPSSTFTVTVGP